MSAEPNAIAPQLTASERLEQSRERMRAWMQSRRPRARPARGADEPPAEWLEKLRGNPLVASVIDAVQVWWAGHPLRKTLVVGEAALREGVAPVAKTHPLAVVVAALLVGALLARTRIVRRVLRPALFAGLLTQIASRLVERAPLEALLDLFKRFRRGEKSAAPTPEATSGEATAASPVQPAAPSSAQAPEILH